MTERERVLWCAIKYAHAVDDDESTEAVLSELTPRRMAGMGDSALWETHKAVKWYLEKGDMKHVLEWERVHRLILDELDARRKYREGGA